LWFFAIEIWSKPTSSRKSSAVYTLRSGHRSIDSPQTNPCKVDNQADKDHESVCLPFVLRFERIIRHPSLNLAEIVEAKECCIHHKQASTEREEESSKNAGRLISHRPARNT
jgi:hypothetical protein